MADASPLGALIRQCRFGGQGDLRREGMWKRQLGDHFTSGANWVLARTRIASLFSLKPLHIRPLMVPIQPVCPRNGIVSLAKDRLIALPVYTSASCSSQRTSSLGGERNSCPCG